MNSLNKMPGVDLIYPLCSFKRANPADPCCFESRKHNHLEMKAEYVQLNHSLRMACGFISMRHKACEALLTSTTCLFAYVCAVYEARDGPRAPRELWDCTSLTGAVNSRSVRKPAFICSLNYRVHLSWGFGMHWPRSCWEKQWLQSAIPSSICVRPPDYETHSCA